MLNKRLQNWLTETGTSRAALAAMLHVKPRTVDSWLGHANLRPIPRNKVDIIENIIRPKAETGEIPLTLSFTPEQWASITAGLPADANISEILRERLLAFIDAARIGH